MNTAFSLAVPSILDLRDTTLYYVVREEWGRSGGGGGSIKNAIVKITIPPLPLQKTNNKKTPHLAL